MIKLWEADQKTTSKVRAVRCSFLIIRNQNIETVTALGVFYLSEPKEKFEFSPILARPRISASLLCRQLVHLCSSVVVATQPVFNAPLHFKELHSPQEAAFSSMEDQVPQHKRVLYSVQ